MKFSAILGTFLASACFVSAGRYQDGYKDGKDEARAIWKQHYMDDCYSVFEYTVEVKDDLVLGDFKKKPGDNWAVEAYKRGGRDGASAQVIEVQKDCLDPGYCNELGMTASELIVADFCGTFYSLALRNRGPYLLCKDVSTNVCEGNIISKIQQTLKDTGKCASIGNDFDDLTTALVADLQDECESQVNDMIQWDELGDDYGRGDKHTPPPKPTKPKKNKKKKKKKDKRKKN
jgi:hypothetical protein